MTNDDLNTWLNTPPSAVESIACFHGAHRECPRTASDCPCQCHQTNTARLLKETLEHGPVASVATVRAALFDVLDSNTEELYAFDCENHRVTDEGATEGRCRFVDSVCNRIAALQAPPFNFDAELLSQVKEAKEGRNRD